jgi:hypothetical protein
VVVEDYSGTWKAAVFDPPEADVLAPAADKARAVIRGELDRIDVVLTHLFDE